MKRLTLAVAVAAGVVFGGAAEGYDPPELIGHLWGTGLSPNDFGKDFTCVGDQNGDGFDDILVSHGTWSDGNPDSVYANRVELYFGGDPMDSIPDFIMSGPTQGPYAFGSRVNFLGRLTDSENPYWAIVRSEYNADRFLLAYRSIQIFEAGAALDTTPEFVIRSYNISGAHIGYGRNSRPCDLNGDGYNDLIGAAYYPEFDSTHACMSAWFGGPDFDTLPDWKGVLHSRANWIEVSTGCDVNGDGCDDALVRYPNTDVDRNQPPQYYALYLGGDPPPTDPALDFRSWRPGNYDDHINDTTMRYGFALIPDVNDDGYDDWAMVFDGRVPWDRWARNGVYLFYGSAEPDTMPDFRLTGTVRAYTTTNDLTGCDLNADGRGDILMTSDLGYTDDGQLDFHFGSRWMDRTPDLSVNGWRTYRTDRIGVLCGASGDYNGDGVTDIAVARLLPTEIFLLAGSRSWRVDAPKEEESPPEKLDVTFNASPNPFNQSVRLTVDLFEVAKLELLVYDSQGRLVDQLSPPTHGLTRRVELDWTAPASGVYLFECRAESKSGKVAGAMQKGVCVR